MNMFKIQASESGHRTNGKASHVFDELREKKAVILDKDGVFLDISRMLHENNARGFAKQRELGVKDMEFDYLPDTVYKMRGIREDYNGGIKPLLALMAINRYAKSKENISGLKEEEILRKVVTNQAGADVLDTLISRFASSQEDVKLANKIYIWDGGSFYNSKEALQYMNLIPGAKEALSSLLQIYEGRVAILTNTPTRQAVVRDLEFVFSTEQLKQIQVLCRADGAEYYKPSPAGPLKIMETMEVSPKDTYIVGDAVIDMVTGRNAGIFSVGVLSGMGQASHLKAAGADVVLSDLKEIVSLLR